MCVREGAAASAAADSRARCVLSNQGDAPQLVPVQRQERAAVLQQHHGLPRQLPRHRVVFRARDVVRRRVQRHDRPVKYSHLEHWQQNSHGCLIDARHRGRRREVDRLVEWRRDSLRPAKDAAIQRLRAEAAARLCQKWSHITQAAADCVWTYNREPGISWSRPCMRLVLWQAPQSLIIQPDEKFSRWRRSTFSVSGCSYHHTQPVRSAPEITSNPRVACVLTQLQLPSRSLLVEIRL